MNISAARTSKRVSLIFSKEASQPLAVRPEAPNDGSAKEKENKDPKQPTLLENGYKPLVLGTVPVVTPRIPEGVVHPTHGYSYF